MFIQRTFSWSSLSESHFELSTLIRLIIIANRRCLSFSSLYTLTVVTVNIANPALGVTSLYKDLYEDEEDETFILYQSYMLMSVILVPLVSIITQNVLYRGSLLVRR